MKFLLPQASRATSAGAPSTRTLSTRASAARVCAASASVALLLSACATAPDTSAAAQRYRCEANVEFSARFSGESVAIDGTRGYELLFRDAKPLPNPPKPNEYRSPIMSAEFNLGKDGREALLRYPLLPLVLRCVKDL